MRDKFIKNYDIYVVSLYEIICLRSHRDLCYLLSLLSRISCKTINRYNEEEKRMVLNSYLNLLYYAKKMFLFSPKIIKLLVKYTITICYRGLKTNIIAHCFA